MTLLAMSRKNFENTSPNTIPVMIDATPTIMFSKNTSLFSCFLDAPRIVIKPNCRLLLFKKQVTE